jgi:hypothetical protein
MENIIYTRYEIQTKVKAKRLFPLQEVPNYSIIVQNGFFAGLVNPVGWINLSKPGRRLRRKLADKDLPCHIG